ncbi:hypothetical protein E0Z10_g8797 [Xylaria hypoxylon]|uniref:Protein kinase domain-containing protein n=1 Tax=Xylaria hypoxylon TaxID=37992 RepID=A0A4Z0Y809_9PEZI|nr:hypothetical protein E0Z10_g8797 [Xylaria hypoxylon]
MNHVPQPPDPDRPGCPYIPGFAMQVTEHHPPAPFGQGGYGVPKHRYEISDSRLGTTPQTQHVLADPPQETEWPSNTPPRSAVLTITNTISIGEAHGAQLVACHLLSDQEEPYAVVAKIYDALYYPSHDHGNTPRNPVRDADCDYSREALAYRHLETTKRSQKPGFAPKYYGSWTFGLTLTAQGNVHKRPIRLILIERLAGSSIRDLCTHESPDPDVANNAYHLNEAYRLDILANILEGRVKQLYSGLDQNDLAPRNVMLVPSPQETMLPGPEPRAVLIDYSISIVYEFTKYGRNPFHHLIRPQNPAERYWSSPPLDLQGWVPSEWFYQDQRSYQEWLLTRFGGSNAINFAPIKEKLVFKDEEPDPETHPGRLSF